MARVKAKTPAAGRRTKGGGIQRRVPGGSNAPKFKRGGSDGKRLAKVYYDPAHPAGFASVRKLEKALPDIDPAIIKEWITYQNPLTIHKPARKRFSRLKIRVSAIDQQWQADLCDMQKYKGDNDGFKYLMTVIDCFSKYAWAVPLKSKTADEIVRGLTLIFEDSGRKCTCLQSDKGKEFKNRKVKAFLEKENVRFFTADNPDIKALIVERFNRTLKTKMWKYFTHKKTTRYVDVLDQLLDSYNNSKHSKIKMAPSQVNEVNSLDVYRALYGEDQPPSKNTLDYKFKEGDYVRIRREKRTFEKGYEATFTLEKFVVSKQLKHHRTHAVYKLKDLRGEELDSLFYEIELVKVSKPDGREKYDIEKVLERKDGRMLVKWVGYPPSFNEWIPQPKGKK